MPQLSVVVPTFNNEAVLRRCLASWQQHTGGLDVELIVVEDGCRDGTRAWLEEVRTSAWGAKHLHAIHLDDAHELRCTNAGMRLARAPLMMAWQDDMFVTARWLVPEIIATFEEYPDIGMMSLSRGLDLFPLDEPIDRWEDLVDWRRLRSTIGPAPGNWFRVQEVDSVVRPWILRRAATDTVGLLDEAFVPTEWDEADLAFRIRAAGWKIATCGYERLAGYRHLGSSTLGELSEAYKARVLGNGRLFHERWSRAVADGHSRTRRTWRRRLTAASSLDTLTAMARAALSRARPGA